MCGCALSCQLAGGYKVWATGDFGVQTAPELGLKLFLGAPSCWCVSFANLKFTSLQNFVSQHLKILNIHLVSVGTLFFLNMTKSVAVSED